MSTRGFCVFEIFYLYLYLTGLGNELPLIKKNKNMKSKIKFDVVPFSGKPAILVSCQYSDDIRDKIVMNFISDVQSKDCKLIMKPDEYSEQEIGELRFFITTE